jgi:NAD(P)-dependent dehydrogenase (short-subunit alcohol dehydrogenase family)
VVGVVAVTNTLLPLLRRSASPRIVNVSSSMGSLTRAGDPASELPPILGYNSSKAALNSVTVTYAKAIRDTPIKVNAACPGYCATDINGHSGPRSAAQGAAIAVRLATLPADGPTGGFFDDDGPVPW